MKINRTLLGFMHKEFIQALRDVRMRLVLFGVPIIQLIIFGFALNTEVRNIRLAAVYAPGDAIMRRVEARAMASGWFVAAHPHGSDPFKWIQSNQANVVLFAPPGGLTRAVQRGEGRVQALIDATNMLRARGAELYLQAALREVEGEVFPDRLRKEGLTFRVRTLYNPSLRTAYFLVPGVMAMLLCIVTVILTSMSLSRERELGTFEALVAAPLKNWEIILGKILPFMVLALADVPLILTVSMLLFGLPMRGPFWALVLAAVIFICATVAIGMMISTFARNQQQAMLGGFLFLFPALLLSGIIFPIENMPPALIGIAYLDPLMYFIRLLRNIMLKGGEPSVIWPHVGALTLMAVAAMTVSYRRFHQTLN